MLQWLADMRGYKRAWCHWTYRDRWHEWPDLDVPVVPIEADDEVIAFVDDKLARFAEARAQEAQEAAERKAERRAARAQRKDVRATREATVQWTEDVIVAALPP